MKVNEQEEVNNIQSHAISENKTAQVDFISDKRRIVHAIKNVGCVRANLAALEV